MSESRYTFRWLAQAAAQYQTRAPDPTAFISAPSSPWLHCCQQNGEDCDWRADSWATTKDSVICNTGGCGAHGASSSSDGMLGIAGLQRRCLYLAR